MNQILITTLYEANNNQHSLLPSRVLVLCGSLGLMYIFFHTLWLYHACYDKTHNNIAIIWGMLHWTLTFNVPCNMFVVNLLSTQVYLDYLGFIKVITLELVQIQKKGTRMAPNINNKTTQHDNQSTVQTWKKTCFIEFHIKFVYFTFNIALAQSMWTFENLNGDVNPWVKFKFCWAHKRWNERICVEATKFGTINFKMMNKHQ